MGAWHLAQQFTHQHLQGHRMMCLELCLQPYVTQPMLASPVPSALTARPCVQFLLRPDAMRLLFSSTRYACGPSTSNKALWGEYMVGLHVAGIGAYEAS